MKYQILVLACALFLACTPRASQYEIVKPEFEVSNSLQDEIQEINNQDTEFVVGDAEISSVWQRANLFAEHFLGVKSSYTYQQRGERAALVGLKFESNNYEFLVTKDEVRKGQFLISITCKAKSSGSDDSLATRNAHNLARFLKQGKLQMALLSL